MKNISYIILFIVFFSTCKKDDESAPQSINKGLKQITVKGKAMNISANIPFSNLDVRVIWRNPKDKTSIQVVSTSKTDNNGGFNFEAAIDTSLFTTTDLYLELITPDSLEYLFYNPLQLSPTSLGYKMNLSKVQEFNFNIFTYTTIKIHLIKKVDSTIKAVNLLCAPMSTNTWISVYWEKNQSSNQDTIMTYPSADNIGTKIKIYKFLQDNTMQLSRDTFVCKKGLDNTYEVEF